MSEREAALRKRTAQLEESVATLQRYHNGLAHLRSIQVLNILAQEDAPHLIHLAGKFLLGSYQVDSEVQALKAMVEQLQPEPVATGRKPRENKTNKPN